MGKKGRFVNFSPSLPPPLPINNEQSLIHHKHEFTASKVTKIVILYLPTFLRYKHEIFILGVLGFFKATRSLPKIPEEVQSLPKTSEVC